jgi:CheY-specific phosphatase CheX
VNPDHSETLARVFTEVLEQLAFMFVETPDTTETPESENLVSTTMAFRGPCSGTVTLAVTREMAPALAANVLGLDPDDDLTTQASYDALKELLNVTCGNVLTAIAGDEPVFDLTVPEVAECTAEAWTELAERPGTIYCLVDDFPVLLHLEIQE